MDRSLVRIALGMLVLTGAPLGGQTLIPDTPTCAACRITMTPVVTLQPSAALPIPNRPVAVTVDGLGRYWLTFSGGRPLAMGFGADGRAVGQVGREGTGPDLYSSAAPVLPLPGDSLLVYDGVQQRFNVLSSDLRVRRQIEQGERALGLAILDWPNLLIATRGENVDARSGQPVYTTLPFQTITMEGPHSSIVRSFGGGGGGGVVATSGGFWTWNYNPYRLEHWSVEGQMVDAIERRPSWYFPEGAHPPRTVGQLPPSHLQGVQEDSTGRLWVFANEGVVRWEDASVSITRLMEKIYNTRIEIIDPVARTLYASVLLPAFVIAPLPGLKAAIYETDAQGKPVVRIVQLTLATGSE